MAVEEYEVVVIGAGPAGLSAGIFVARQRTKCLVISKDLGGQLNLIPKLENYSVYNVKWTPSGQNIGESISGL